MIPLHISGIGERPLELDDGEAEAVVAANISLMTIRMMRDRQRLPGAGDDLRAGRRAAPGAAAARQPGSGSRGRCRQHLVDGRGRPRRC